MADAILVWLDMLDQPTLGMLRMSFFLEGATAFDLYRLLRT